MASVSELKLCHLSGLVILVVHVQIAMIMEVNRSSTACSANSIFLVCNFDSRLATVGAANAFESVVVVIHFISLEDYDTARSSVSIISSVASFGFDSALLVKDIWSLCVPCLDVDAASRACILIGVVPTLTLIWIIRASIGSDVSLIALEVETIDINMNVASSPGQLIGRKFVIFVLTHTS